MKQKSFFMPTKSLDAALKKAAHRAEMSQNKFIAASLCMKIRSLKDPELDQLLDEHEANMAEAQEQP